MVWSATIMRPNRAARFRLSTISRLIQVQRILALTLRVHSHGPPLVPLILMRQSIQLYWKCLLQNIPISFSLLVVYPTIWPFYKLVTLSHGWINTIILLPRWLHVLCPCVYTQQLCRHTIEEVWYDPGKP